MERKTILLVEDDPASIDIFVTMLEHGGYVVLTAANAAEGVEMALSHRPDLVVVDIGLPDALGFEVLDDLTTNPSTADIPLIVCTVHVFENDISRAWQAGCDVFLEKPVAPRDLLMEVDRLLGSASAEPRPV